VTYGLDLSAAHFSKHAVQLSWTTARSRQIVSQPHTRILIA
jgi:hypothetical protein